MKNMTKEVISYKCEWCGQLHNSQVEADKCALGHAKENLANSMLEEGRCLKSIKYFCGFNWNLSKEQEEITKDNCFIISHWQCCEKPAYRITRIDKDGKLRLYGRGSWSAGGYGEYIRFEKLPKPHSKEEFYEDLRSL